MSQQSTQATAFVTPVTPESRLHAVNEEKKRKRMGTRNTGRSPLG